MKLTYIGHATVLMEMGSLNILTDPWFTEGPAVAKRKKIPTIQPSGLPKIDLILLSHEHFDHFDKKSLQLLEKDCTVIAHAGLKSKIEKLGFEDVKCLKVWETTEKGSLKITATPADHTNFSLGFLLQNDQTIYFAGDTKMIPVDFERIGETYSLDLAILPIGGVKIFGMIKKVMDPDDAVKALGLLKPANVLPIHWGTFKEKSVLMTMPGMPETFTSLITQENLSCTVLQLDEGASMEL